MQAALSRRRHLDVRHIRGRELCNVAIAFKLRSSRVIRPLRIAKG